MLNTEIQSKIKPGLMVHAKSEGSMGGAKGIHVGTVDHIDGERYIKLTKKDSNDGEHHWIPLDWVEDADEKAVYLSKTEDQMHAEQFDSFPGLSEQQKAL